MTEKELTLINGLKIVYSMIIAIQYDPIHDNCGLGKDMDRIKKTIELTLDIVDD